MATAVSEVSLNTPFVTIDNRPTFYVSRDPNSGVLRLQVAQQTYCARPVGGLDTMVVTEECDGGVKFRAVGAKDAEAFVRFAVKRALDYDLVEGGFTVRQVVDTRTKAGEPIKRDRAQLAAHLAAESANFTMELVGEDEVRRFFELLEPYNAMRTMNLLPATFAKHAERFPQRVTVGNEGSLVVYVSWFGSMLPETLESVCEAVKDAHGAAEAGRFDDAVWGRSTLRFWWD